MQEEIENRTVQLAVRTTKLTARAVVSAVRKLLQDPGLGEAEAGVKGKQTVRELVGQDQGVSRLDISKTELRGFENYARSFGVDYAILKNDSVSPAGYMVFFKAKDKDAILTALDRFGAEAAKIGRTPSVLSELRQKLKEANEEKTLPVPEKTAQRDLEGP